MGWNCVRLCLAGLEVEMSKGKEGEDRMVGTEKKGSNGCAQG